MIDVSDRLRAIRTHLGETQKTMSTRFGLGEATWQSYELGGRLPKPEVMRQLATLGFDANWILTGHGAMLRRDNRGAPKSRDAAAPFDESLLEQVIRGLEESMTKFSLELSPEKKGHAMVVLYKYFAANAAGDPKPTSARVTAAAQNLPRIDRLTCVREVIESLRAKKLLELYLRQRFGKSHLDDLGDDQLRETAVWALSLQDTLPAEAAPASAARATQDGGGS